MSEKLDKNECFLCLHAVKAGSKNVRNFTSKFLVFLLRHLKMRWKNNCLDTTTDQFMVCEDCLKLVESFCDLYSKLKCVQLQLNCVQLQLNWKVETIFETMLHAEQVPMSSLRNDKDDNGRKRYIDDDDHHDVKSDMKNIHESSDSDKLRKNLIKHWKKQSMSIKQRVELRRIKTESKEEVQDIPGQSLAIDRSNFFTSLNVQEAVNNSDPKLNLHAVGNINGRLQFQFTGPEELQSNRSTMMMIAESQAVEVVSKEASQELPQTRQKQSKLQKKLSVSTKKHIQEVSKVFADVRILDQTQMVFDVLPTTSYSDFQPEPEDLFMDDNVDEGTEMKVPLEHLQNYIEIMDGFNDSHVPVDVLNNDEMCERVGVINNPEQNHSQVEHVLVERTPLSSSSTIMMPTKIQTRKVIPKPKQRFECHICGKSLNRASNLRCHMREIHKTVSNFEGAYQCQICLEKIARPGHLQKHSKIHQNTNFNCEQCALVFETKYRLYMHTYAVHKKPKTQEAPWTWRIVCDIDGCQRKFATYGSLAMHQTKSHSVKPKPTSSKVPSSF